MAKLGQNPVFTSPRQKQKSLQSLHGQGVGWGCSWRMGKLQEKKIYALGAGSCWEARVQSPLVEVHHQVTYPMSSRKGLGTRRLQLALGQKGQDS